MNHIEVFKTRMDSLQITAMALSQKMLSNLKHSDYEFFINRRR
ncbi:hypothetical protein KC19_4G006000 [Ceratodon purpureus]|uniref:Uncharacterized protein n=1 Tax=Ceratodon purpureus TaxID=3225 RepID=A0A8T0I537_CERPU|nr:hypothetical protein KC19_4G006000 [Ceratodon purpureus]